MQPQQMQQKFGGALVIKVYLFAIPPLLGTRLLGPLRWSPAPTLSLSLYTGRSIAPVTIPLEAVSER